MGKSMSNCGTQAKERARQQKQMDKASKRMFARQKREHAKANAPNVSSDRTEPLFTVSVAEGTGKEEYYGRQRRQER